MGKRRQRGANFSTDVFEENGVRVLVLSREVLEKRAIRYYNNRYRKRPVYGWPKDRITVQYIRHALTNYPALVRGLTTAEFATLSETVFVAISKAYPWLAEECIRQHLYRGEQGRYGAVRVIKHGALLPKASEEPPPVYDDDEFHPEVNLSGALCSLASERVIYFPPFLHVEAIRERRFSGEPNMNDRWWEWEEELNLVSLDGRPNAFHHIHNFAD